MSLAGSDTTQAWEKGLGTTSFFPKDDIPAQPIPNTYNHSNDYSMPSNDIPASSQAPPKTATPNVFNDPFIQPRNSNLPTFSTLENTQTASVPTQYQDLKIQAVVNQLKKENASTVTVPPSHMIQSNGEKYDKKVLWIQNIVENPFFIAIATGLLTMLILILLNPPFIQKKVDNPIHKSTPDLVRVFIYALVATAAAYVLPLLLCRASHSNKS